MSSQHLAAFINSFAQTDPTRIAIKSAETVLSYQELDHESNRIANFFDEKVFRETSQPNPNLNVCVMLDRSAEIITVIIGIIKAGLVFVPVSPHFPEKRIQLLLEEAKTRWVITSPEYFEKFQALFFGKSDVHVLTVGDFKNQSTELQFEMRYNKYSYIYFTSGSTGIPKGVLGRHKSLQHFIQWEINEFGINDTFYVSQLTPPTFDPYLRDIFVPLLAGGTLCIPDYNTLMNPGKLIGWINDNKIGLIHIVPSLFKLISSEINSAENFLDLKYILLAGELLRGNDIRKFIDIFNDRIQLVNIYGPTETTLAKFFYRIQTTDCQRSIIPVGKTITDAEAFVLDEHRHKCLTGNIGEIYIRTPYISSGYFNNKELNKEVFIQNPFSTEKNDIIYKTGDMGRFLFDGNVELIGRLDGQVKIRGNRVEIGEIENRLLSIEDIKDAVVVDKEDKNGEKYLCAFLSLKNNGPTASALDITQLNTILAKNLPVHMLPSYYIPLSSMPLNPNGKINRDALRKLDFTFSTSETYIPPKDELEKKIVGIWQEVLDQDKIGLNDNFFSIGGTSLNAIQVNSKINEMLGLDIPIVKFFEYHTIGLYVKFLKSLSTETQESEKEKVEMSVNNMTKKRSTMASRKEKMAELRKE